MVSARSSHLQPTAGDRVIVVHTEGTEHEFDEASRVCTDEHNNLEVRDRQDRLTTIFNRSEWRAVEIDYG